MKLQKIYVGLFHAFNRYLIMKHKNYLFYLPYLFILLVGHMEEIQAQPVCQIQHFSMDDGLSQSFVQRVFQAEDDVLWFSTWNGLDCYDGYSFSNYNMSSQGGSALMTNRIIEIIPGKKGDIWCQTYDNRIYLFEKLTHTFLDILSPLEKELKYRVVVKNIYVLPKGVVWVTCENGYNFRIDEVNSKMYENITLYSQYAENLKGNEVWNVYQDNDGDEWILTDKGIDIIGKKKLQSDFPFKSIKEWNGCIYLVSKSDQLAVYRPETDSVQFIDTPPIQGHIHYAVGVTRDTLAFQTDYEILFLATRDNSIRVFDIEKQVAASHHIQSFYVDKQGDCWIFTDKNQILRVDAGTMTHKRYTVPMLLDDEHSNRKGRTVMFEDHNGTFWILPQQGAMCYYDKARDCFRIYLQDKSAPKSAYFPSIRFYTFDRQGNMWCAANMGLEKITFLSHFFTLKQLEKNMDVRSFLTDNQGRIWAGSQNGVLRIYRRDGSFEGYLGPDGRIHQEYTTFPSGVYALMLDKDNTVWIGTKEHGLYNLHPSEKNIYSVQHYMCDKKDAYTLNSNAIYSLLQDSHGRIWVGSFSGGLNLLIRDDDGVRFIHEGNELKNYPVSYGMKVRCLSKSDDGVLMAGTTDGLLAFSENFNRPEEIKFYHHMHQENDPSSLHSNDIMSVYNDKSGRVYALSFTGGINTTVPAQLLTDRAQFTHYTQKNGLISNLVYSMAEDRQGNLWVVTENGFSRFDPCIGRFKNYRSGLVRSNLRFAETVPLITEYDKLLIGTNMGILEVSLNEINEDKYIPTVVFTEVKIQGQTLDRDANLIDKIILKPSQRNISFRFSAIDFINAKNLQYAYRLRGLEEEWNEVGNSRSASYMNLPAGTYTLEVRSTNSNGVWMNNVRTIRLEVEPTFSETFWAWMLYIFLVLLFIGIICYVLFYIYRLRHRIRMEQHLADIKLRFFADISHELRTPLTLISSPVNEVLQNEPLSKNARENLNFVKTNTQRMLRMMNQILDFRKIQKEKMKIFVEETDLIELLRQVMEHFQTVAHEKHIDFRLSTNVSSLCLWLDRDKTEKIFFNLISNAFKYTPAGKSICIEVHPQDKEVQIVVADQGIGIESEQQKTLFQRFETFAHYNTSTPSSGIGLSLVKEMVQMHHGHVEVVSEVGKGSRFIVSLPLDKSVYEHDTKAEFILNDSESSVDPAEEPCEQEEQNDRTVDEEKSDDCLSVLVVEDNEELRQFLFNILSGTYRVLEAVNGEQGLTLALEHIPDIIISDVMMPVMDGLELVKKLKEDRTTCHIPVIILSAKSSLDDRIAGLEQGIDDYITKPFSSTYLKVRITSLLHQRRELQEMYMAKIADQQPAKMVADHLYEPSTPELVSLDEQFMQQVMAFMEENMENEDLEIEEMARHLYMSRTIFYRKLKSITGLTPVEFVREVRLKRAIQLMDRDGYTVSQVAYMTGFSDPKYFGRCFKKMMGMTPTEYKERKGMEN